MLISCHPDPVCDTLLDRLIGPLDLADTRPDRSIHRELRGRIVRLDAGHADALDPGPVLDGTLHDLVGILTAPAGPAPGTDRPAPGEIVARIVERLDRPEAAARATLVRTAAGLAEGRMERHFARLALDGPPPPVSGPAGLAGLLARFPYLDNYFHLVDAELDGLRVTGRPLTSLAVAGAGPLPLTGIIAHLRTGCRVRLIDSDPEAAELAAALVSRLERSGIVSPGAISTSHCLAEDADLGTEDAVLVAALVPSDALLAIADRLAGRRRPATLLARSARGLVGHFAYRPIDTTAVTATGLRALGATVPDNAAGSHAPDATDQPRPLALAHHSVLNTCELFATS